MSPPLYFLHIPKTAGTSVTAVLDAHFAPGEIFPGGLLPHLLRTSGARLQRYRLFRGHFGRVLPAMLGAEPRTLTVLREPVAMVDSLLRHIQRDPVHYFHERCSRPGYGLAEFLEDEACRPLVANPQARWLAFLPTAAHWGWRPPVPRGYALYAQAVFDLCPHGMDDAELAERWLASLAGMVAVGVTERLDETLRAFAGALGWPAPPEPPRLNRAPAPPPERSAAVEERARELCAVDAILHQAAARLLDERLAATAGA